MPRIVRGPLIRLPLTAIHTDSISGTTLLGYVREEEEVFAGKTLEISAPASNTPHKALVSTVLPPDGPTSRDSIPDCVLKTWDEFPNGRFRVHFTREQFTATSKVALYWASRKLRGGRRGSTSAATPDRGCLSLHGCSGIIESNSGECTVQIAPGLDVSKEIKVGCACGLALRHRPCTAEWSLVQYNEGAIFEHGGLHTHSSYTHSLPKSGNKLKAFVPKPPVSLSQSNGDVRTIETKMLLLVLAKNTIRKIYFEYIQKNTNTIRRGSWA
ncbi:hypothetical protein FB45DRAFT_873154 [Roridomyces roridus]|uniref:Uncharacterized protein n=1 Tax=Roridomyces roridus TaxID=1738132 RepID=A0AAD7FEL7_9AGAR|nr:hypothetical protein FB45DRAFT_873154 [Roridomyces roridus]